MSGFVHLHVHSEYSLLDGLPHPKQIAARAAELQQPAIAITDHGSMFAAIEFYDACKAKNLKPIIGVEAYLAKRRMKDRDSKEDRSSNHLLLLAENDEGYHNLLKLISKAELEGFYYYPRVDHELLEQYSAGLICTTGCPSGEVPRLLHDGKKDEARKQLDWYRQVFKERFYVELQEHGIAEFAGLDTELIALAREFNLPLVATNDAHYLRPQDAVAQDVLLCIQTGTVVNDPKRMRMDGADYYLKSSDEMRAVWREVPEAIANTLAVAERCNINLDFNGYRLPIFPVPEGYTAESYLRSLCEIGFKKYFPNGSPAARARLDYELGVVHTMGFDTYFLIVWDLCRFARTQNIWYNVRGSAAGSMAAYCCGITNLDPLQHRLIFERFLNPGRISMPDIDLDFQDDRRSELISYTIQKYGKDNVAQIVTFGTLGAKAAIRDVGRALDYPLAEVDRVAKLLPTAPNTKLDECLESVPEFKQVYESSDYLHKLIDNARALEGVARHASTHAAGVVVTDRPVADYVPLHRPTKGEDSGGFPVTQFEMGILERVGLLKMDYLGLATLTIMKRACELIEKRHGAVFDLYNIPVEDEKGFDLLARGDVTGVFQVEGQGMRKVLMQMRPRKFEHIVATISLYRPGPIDYIPSYINRLHGDEKVEYKHPSLQPILEETFGIMVYQEQIMEIAMQLAGYTASDADFLRKAVGKKDKEKILKERAHFIERAEKQGIITLAVAEKIFDDVEFFARYGFNKAHAADYAVLTCQTAYLKAHYPIEYMSALLTTETGTIEKVGQLVGEIRRMGIDVVKPDVNTSDAEFAIAPDGKAIYFSLSAIKNVGSGPVKVIVDARKAGGAFKSLDDFCHRVDLRLVNRRVLESLAKAGALDRFGRRSQLLKVLDRMLATSQAAHQASDRGQLSMFGATSLAPGLMADTFGTLPDEPEVPNRDKLADEKELTGAYFSDNPLMRLAKANSKQVTHFVNQIDESLVGQKVALAGVVTNAHVIQTKKGDTMAFIQVEDPTGTAEITVFPKIYERTRDLWRLEAIVLARGKVELRDGKTQILCDSADEYDPPAVSDDPNVPPTDHSQPVPSSSNAPIQYAMPADDHQAAMVDVAELIDDLPMSYEDAIANLPPPEEPPDEGEWMVDKGQSAVASQPPTANHQTTSANHPSAAVTAPFKPNGHDTGDGNGHTKPNGSNGGAHAAVPAATPVPTRAAESPARYQPARHVYIRLTRSQDHDEEVRRLKELLSLLVSANGRDRFTFYVPNPQGTVQLDFPNHSTNYGVLQEPLMQMIGEWGTVEVQ